VTVLKIVLRVYLFAGLAAHKILWEVMKRGQGKFSAPAGPKPSLFTQLVKVVKVAVMLGLFAQLFLPEILPISENPFVPRVVGLIIFTFGLAIAMMARRELGNNWSDIETGEVKQDHMLVNQGIYRYIRHPIYSGDLAMLFGFECCLNSWLVLAVLVIAIPTVYKAVNEEKVLAETVNGYQAYRTQTKRFIPFVI
jgi:protein-S-isoprenylcysteine O-methyltransferase Ste14